jgi:hypothetical protein
MLMMRNFKYNLVSYSGESSRPRLPKSLYVGALLLIFAVLAGRNNNSRDLMQMALRPCRECKAEVSTEADVCPHSADDCGVLGKTAMRVGSDVRFPG